MTKKHRGIFNKYHKNMPAFERFLKDINHAVLWLLQGVRYGFPPRTLLVYPHYPSRKSTIYNLGVHLGYNLTNKPHAEAEVAVYWEYLTFREEYEWLQKLNSRMPVINLYSRDISKLHIDAVHQEIFGYSTAVNPLEYRGKMVRKSDVNARHDGAIVQGPLTEKEEGNIYQILIDNQHGEAMVMDIRVPVIGGLLNFVYLKYRHIHERFKNPIRSVIVPIDEALSTSEITTLEKYCEALHLEYGELDVLRHREDGKIYVVDVNNTPQGPPTYMGKKEYRQALKLMGKALQKLIQNKIAHFK